jgi:hypothetical protein
MATQDPIETVPRKKKPRTGRGQLSVRFAGNARSECPQDYDFAAFQPRLWPVASALSHGDAVLAEALQHPEVHSDFAATPLFGIFQPFERHRREPTLHTEDDDLVQPRGRRRA